MRVTLPRMGVATCAFKGFYEALGFEFVEPAPLTRRTLDLGVSFSPEFACLPFKITLGNLIETLKERGSDVVAVLGGVGPCRFGYYGVLYRKILGDVGFRFEFEMFDPPSGRFENRRMLLDILRRWARVGGKLSAPSRLVRAFYLAWRKLKAAEALEAELLISRAHDLKGAERAFARALREVDEAGGADEVEEAARRGLAELRAIRGGRPRARMALVGEIYTVVEPFASCYVERTLGEMGVEVHKSVSTSHFAESVLFAKAPWPLSCFLPTCHEDELNPFLLEDVGGHGRRSVAVLEELKRDGFDAAVHLMPFGCMPEVTAQLVIPRASEAVGLPVISLAFDEQTSEAGVRTRLEAFLDMVLWRKRRCA